MPRDIPVGNGQMLVTFDQHYQVRDFYFPHVGQENHAGAGPCRFGVWGPLATQNKENDRRKRRLCWSDQGWDIRMGYRPDTLVTDVVMSHAELGVELRCCDAVDFHRPLLVRRIGVVNLRDEARDVHLFHHHDFNMYGTKVGDTAYFDPQLRCLIHYRTNRYIMATWHADGEQRIDEYATGTAGFRGAEGTWRDAEDGTLGNNAIAQGAVDSTMMLQLSLPPRGSRVVYLVIGAGMNYQDMVELHRFLHHTGPQGVIDRTTAYWRLWLTAARGEFPEPERGGPSPKVVDLFRRSLLIVRSQIDNATGAIIAANDSDIMQFSRDTYSYLWPRDGALGAAAMDEAGFPDVARSFYSLCSRIINEHGYLLHKYNPDGSPASSWHPWVSMGRPQLPIQEDETALVLWALWRHFLRYRDIEFVRPMWVNLITKAADFLVRFRDPDTHLPLPCYNLWEDSWGVHAFTVATVFGGLEAARQFALCFGDAERAAVYGNAAQQVRDAFCNYFWSEKDDRFLRRLVPLDHDRTARLMAEVMACRTPRPDAAEPFAHLAGDHQDSSKPHRRSGDHRSNGGNGKHGPPQFERDEIVDSSLYAIFALEMLDVHDPRVDKTMRAVESRLWVKTASGGLARYENDTYHLDSRHAQSVPGNPWFICTLWLAQWRIAKAQSVDELREALPILEWVAAHALPSGVLAEQVHPHTGAPLSVSPLTWSHAALVSVVTEYLRKLEQTHACPTCGQPRQGVLTERVEPQINANARK